MRSVHKDDPNATPPTTGAGRAPKNEIRDMEVGEVRAAPWVDQAQVRSLVCATHKLSAKRFQTWRVRVPAKGPDKGSERDEVYVRRLPDDVGPKAIS